MSRRSDAALAAVGRVSPELIAAARAFGDLFLGSGVVAVTSDDAGGRECILVVVDGAVKGKVPRTFRGFHVELVSMADASRAEDGQGATVTVEILSESVQ